MPDPVLPATARTLLARVARTQRDGRAPSLVAGVVRDGGLAWSAGRGDVPEPHDDVQYRLGSISKTVTAVLVMRLRDEGRLALDDPLDRHLPGTPFGERTVGQLLSHLAGASAESPGGWWERVPGGSLADLGLADDDVVLGAARRFHYSNLGFGLLGELVARARGTSWDDAVRAEVLAPLGMSRTTPRPSGAAARGQAVHPWADVVLPEPEHHAGVMAAAGQLWSTLADLGRFAAFLLGDTADVLDPATLEEMTEPAGVDSSAPGWSAYGLGLQVLRVDGRTLVGHGRLDARLPGRRLRRPGRADRRGLPGQRHRGGGAGRLRAAGRPARRRAAGRRALEPRVVAGAAGGPRRLVLGRDARGAARRARRPAAPGPAPRPRRAGEPVPAARRPLGRPGRLLRRRDAADRRGPPRPGHVHLHPDALRPGRARARRRRRGRLDGLTPRAAPRSGNLIVARPPSAWEVREDARRSGGLIIAGHRVG
ncbi:serine hydrolase [Blastococcus sp. TML/C7B]|uniref:serine hydrolase domain-containing protein n=1 Tax=Blastococcus sp. TML/C7B TaxID=2798728 RepID=UPI001F5B6B44|nr:serine hydrolase domain-containing protein [Blastococcus sp. TML/C7B]